MTQTAYDPALSIYRQAFEQTKPEIDSVQEENFVTVSLDIPATVITVQGAYPEIVALRPQFVQHLPTLDITKVDKLETYGLAMFCAHADYKAAIEPSASLVELLDNAIAIRTILLADVNSLIAHGLLAPGVIDGLQGVNGYKNVMTDVALLASILRTNAAKVAARTSIKPDELAAAEDMANKLGKAVGLREQSPQVIAEASRVRQAAYTLFIKAYEEVRSGVQYLRRHEGDADSVAPSLFANRGNRKKPADENTDKPDSPATPVVNPPAPVAPGNNGGAVARVTSSEHGPFME